MKRLIIGCCLLVLMASCGGGQKKVDPFAALTEQIDSMKVLPDSIQDTTVVEEQIPASADESFADFFYNFASDAKFQRSRVVFPFSLYKGKQVKRIQKEEWKHDPLFSREQAYTVLFDKEEDMEMEKDTSMHSVQVDWIFLTEKKIKRYYFERKKDSWFLEAINVEKMAEEHDGKEDFYTVVEEQIPASADESFADFFYNFASDAKFQRSRVVFPFSLYKGKQVKRIQKEEWKHDPLFSREQAYTVLFDKEEDMEMEKDTSMHSVQVDWIFLTEKKIKRYYFERKKDSWFLEAINVEKMAEEHDGKEDFYTFYERFSRDSLFQQERLHEPLYFVTADPEDEFQILETTLEPGQWFAFRPPMIKGKMTNVHYGQPENIHSDYKVVEFKGFGNGFSNTLYFERRENIWQLIRFEDLSD